MTPELEAATRQLRDELLPFWDAYSAPVTFTFLAAATKADVAHGLGQVPGGFLVVWADGPVYAEPGVLWTKELAYLRAPNANTHVVVIFYTLREAPNEG